MDVGCNYLREHIIPEARIHYAITNSGGSAPNTVQSEAEVCYNIRAPKNGDMVDIYEQIQAVAKGAAMMTGTTVDIRPVSYYANYLDNATLNHVTEECMKEIVDHAYTEEELQYAKRFCSGCRKESTDSGSKKTVAAKAICGLTILGMIILDYVGLVPMYIVACVGAILLIVFGVLTENEAIGSIHGPTMFLFIGVLPLSDALKVTGAADVVANIMLKMLGSTTNPYLIMAVFFIIPLILTQVMSNIAVVAVFVPLVSSVAISIGVDPRAGVMAVLITSTTSILTPMAAAAQAMIMAPGGYTMKDYLKGGIQSI